MTIATRDLDTPMQPGEVAAHAVGAAKKIYRGTLVATDNATGFAEAGSDAAAKVFAGVSYEMIDNTDGAAGAKSVRCRQRGLFTFPYTGTAPTGRGVKVYISDDNTVTATASATPVCCGRVERLDTTAGTADVDISRYD